MRTFNHLSVSAGKDAWHISKRIIFNAAAACLCLSSIATGWAQTASSGGYGALADIELNAVGLGSEGLQTGPEPFTNEQGTSNYGPVEHMFLEWDENLLGMVNVDIDILRSTAAYDQNNTIVNGQGGVGYTVIDINLPGLPALQIDAEGLSSESGVTGQCGALNVHGSSHIINGQLRIGDTLVELPANAPPNTVISTRPLGLAGVSIVLNEQIISGDNSENQAIVTNALRIGFAVDSALVEMAGDIILGNSNASLTSCDVSNGTLADLAVVKSAPATIEIGESVTYTIGITNAGPEIATDVLISDPLSLGVELESVSAPGSWFCDESMGVVSCQTETMAVGDTGVITLVATPTNAGVAVNTAFVSALSSDPDNSNNQDTAVTTVEGDESDLGQG